MHAVSAIITVIGLAIALGVRSSQSQSQPSGGPTMSPTDSGPEVAMPYPRMYSVGSTNDSSNESVYRSL